MSGSGSQSQEDTQPVSQSFYKEFSDRIKQQHAAKQLGLNDGLSGLAESAPYTYHQDQTGHVDLLGVFEQPTISHSQTSVQDHSDDGIEPASQVADVRADLYPESKRFQPPTTPSTSSRKHNRAGEMIANPNTTPRLPTNPFASQVGGLEGMMDASQLFKATQALSSPLVNVLPSDGVSERPSPDVKAIQRPSTADPSSSPAKAPRSHVVRSVTEPQTTYISIKESQAERERLSRMQVVGLGDVEREVSDDDFDFDDSQVRRRRLRRKIDQEAKDQFIRITARPGPASIKHSRGYKDRDSRSSPSSRRLGREASEAVILSDDVPAEELHSNDTEEETEREEELDHVDIDDEADELADDNKENVGVKGVQVPMTDSRTNYRTSQLATTPSSPSNRFRGSPTTAHVLDCIDNPSHQSTSTTKKSEDHPPATQTVAIVDSQSSQSHAKVDRTLDAKLQLGESVSSSGPSLLIPQSQLNGAAHRPPRLVNGAEENCPPTAGSVAPVSHDRVDSSPPRSRASSSPIAKIASTWDRSKPRLEKSYAGFNQSRDQIGSSIIIPLKQQEIPTPEKEMTEIRRDGGEGVIRIEGSAEEFPKSAATTEAPSTDANSDRQPDRVSRQKTSIATPAQSTVPETISTSEGVGERYDALTSPIKTGPKPLPDTVPPQNSNGSTPFETAQSHLSIQAPHSPAKQMERSQDNGCTTSPRTSRPRTITEITAGPSPGTASDNVDLDINLLTSDDVEYQTVMNQLSPVRKKRRGNHGRALRATMPESSKAPLAPQAPSRVFTADDQGPLARQSEPIVSQPDVEDASIKVVASKVTKDIDRGANARVETNVKVKSSARGRPRKVKSITTNAHTGATTSGVEHNQAVLASLHKGTAENATIASTRVFAHFNGSCAAYYPATCIGVVGGREPRYKVRFDDGTVDVISGYGIRRLELRPGDVVKLDVGGARTKNYVVESTQDQQLPTPTPDPLTPTRGGRPRPNNLTTYPQTDIYGYGTVVVSLKPSKSIAGDPQNNEQIFVPIKDVYLTQTMWTNFRDRDYMHTTATDQSMSRLYSPSERPSTPSTPSSRTRRINTSGLSKSLSTSLSARPGLFDNMAFAITNVNRVEDNERVTQQILSNGGRILHAGFEELFHIPNLDIASPSKNGPLESKFQAKPSAASLGFTCLIADECCRRAKYIEALALGIPCLATRWIQDCITKRRVLPWIPYLLSSGESAYLGGAVRSRFLQPYAAETATLRTVLENRPRILDGHSVLLIMSKSEEKTMKSHPLITHALGAGKVSRAINVEAAAKAVATAQANGEPWDWVYSHDHEKEVERRLFGAGEKTAGKKRKRGGRESEGGAGLVGEPGRRTKVVGNELVIQSLILGQLVDMD